MAACRTVLLLAHSCCARGSARRCSLRCGDGGGRGAAALGGRRWPPGRRVSAAAARDHDDRLLAGVDAGHVAAVARVLEQAERAAARWEVAHSDFLAPPALRDCLLALRRAADVGVVVSGGRPGAERCRVSMTHAEALTPVLRADMERGAVAAVSVAGDFAFDAAAHGDFLGAVLGAGIVREKVGDVVVWERGGGAHVVVVPELVGFLCATVTRVRGVTVETSPAALADLAEPSSARERVQTVEASLRVDAIASAGFRMSRSKLADAIGSGAVCVNWKEATKSGTTVKSGDMISLRGKGRIEVGDIRVTKKGRYAVEILRYL